MNTCKIACTSELIHLYCGSGYGFGPLVFFSTGIKEASHLHTVSEAIAAKLVKMNHLVQYHGQKTKRKKNKLRKLSATSDPNKYAAVGFHYEGGESGDENPPWDTQEAINAEECEEDEEEDEEDELQEGDESEKKGKGKGNGELYPALPVTLTEEELSNLGESYSIIGYNQLRIYNEKLEIG
jgi:hypothetical protein